MSDLPADFFSEIHDGQTPPEYGFFNGERWGKSESGETSEIHSPVDGALIGSLQKVTSKEINEVMTRVSRAQPAWEATPLNKRVTVMHLAADWIRHYEEYLTTILLREIGKTTGEAKSEILRTADLIDYFADEAVSLRGEMLDSDNFPGFDKGRIAMVEHVAHGVIVCIAPFNYPVNLAASKIAPALLMGNSVVLKPPTQGGISGLYLTQVFLKAGVPKGVLSCVTGYGEAIGDYLVSHPVVSMIAFTGSSETGVHIAGKTAMLPLLFECGGNNPALVLPDADLESCAQEIIKGAFSYAGQRCTAIKYVLTTPSVLETLLPILQKHMADMVHMGDPRSPETKLVGPVISESGAAAIQKAIDEAVRGGAKVLAGGKTKAAYVEPTLLTNVTPSMDVVATEVFGPVLSFITVKSIDEAITIINSSKYGLQASVFTKDEGTGFITAKKISVGTVQINGSPQRGPDHFPFLGIRRSGLGVQGVRYSLEAMSRIQSIVMNKPQ